MISPDDIFVVVTLSWIIFVNQSIITTIAFFPFDLGNGPIISMLISCHSPSDISKECNSPAFSCVTLCFVDTWNIPGHSSSYCFLFLATSSFFWSVPSFGVVLNALCPLVYGFLEEFSLLFFNYSAHKFFYSYGQSHLLPKIDHFFF